MALTGLHTVTTSEYTNILKEFMKINEGEKLKIYLDSKGIATIGIGYALNKDIDTIVSDFSKAGINLSSLQIQRLTSILPDNKSGQITQSNLDVFNSSTDAINLSSTQSDNLFNSVIGQYEKKVKEKLGNDVYNSMANSLELVSLVSLAYNSPALLGPNLIYAIQNGNRVAAWNEILYNSNKEKSSGLQNRREREALMFGKDNVSTTSTEYLKFDNLGLKSVLTKDINGKPTTLFYSENSNLLMYGNTIDNPNKISFTNSDGSYEVWEKINGSFVQTLKVENTTPTPQTTTTIHETASKLNTTVLKLEQSNPWLKSRNSDNLSTIFSNSSNKSLLVKDNTGISYTYTYNSSSDSFENQTPIATADDAINFIANFDGTMSDLQNIQNAVKDAYENNGLSKEYYDAFMESFNTYVKVNTQNNNVTTQPTGNSTRIDKNAFYYYKNINDTALSLANKTFTVLDSTNNAFSVQDLKILDVNGFINNWR